MMRRAVLAGSVRAMVSGFVAGRAMKEEAAKKLLGNVPIAVDDPYTYNDNTPWDFSAPDADYLGRRIAGQIAEARITMLRGRRRDLDHKYRALKSCSPVYLASLQARDDLHADVGRSIDLSKGFDQPSVLAALKRWVLK